MQFRFDANQEFQQRAIASVVDVFQGMTRIARRSTVNMLGTSVDFDTGHTAIDPVKLLANIRAVQRANGLVEDDGLRALSKVLTWAVKPAR